MLAIFDFESPYKYGQGALWALGVGAFQDQLPVTSRFCVIKVAHSNGKTCTGSLIIPVNDLMSTPPVVPATVLLHLLGMQTSCASLLTSHYQSVQTDILANAKFEVDLILDNWTQR